MIKKLSQSQLEYKKVESVVKKIKDLEKKNLKHHVRAAASRYVSREREEIRLKSEIASAEKDLARLKKEAGK